MSINEPPPPPPYPGTSVPGGVPGPAPQNKKAVWSLVLGILGLICCGLLTSIPAIILGHLGKKEVAQSGGTQTGAGLAQAGFVLGIIGTALNLIVGAVFVALFASGNLPSEPMIGPPTNY